MGKKGLRIQVYGRVQGVGFRYYTQKKALELKISGFVRNRSDGSVYIEAEGEPGALALFADWCEVGPDWAHVRRVEKQEIPPQGYEGFEIR